MYKAFDATFVGCEFRASNPLVSKFDFLGYQSETIVIGLLNLAPLLCFYVLVSLVLI